MPDKKHSGGGKAVGLPILLVVLVSILPGFFMFAQNAAELPLAEVLPFMGAALLLGLLAFAVWLLILRRADAAGIVSCVCMLLSLNFGVVSALAEKLFGPDRVLFHGCLTLLIIFAALCLPVILLRKKDLHMVTLALTIAAGTVLLINGITCIPATAKRLMEPRFTQFEAEDKDTERPDLYYIICDEYAGFREMKKYYEHDNSEFYDYLTEKGFSVSEDSYATTGCTLVNLNNLFSLYYKNVSYANSEEKSALQAEATRELPDAPLYYALHELDYDLYQVCNLEVFALPTLSQDILNEGASTMDGETAQDILTANTLFLPLLRTVAPGWYDKLALAAGDCGEYTGTENNPENSAGQTAAMKKMQYSTTRVFNYLADSENYTEDTNTFFLCYVKCPHSPLLFDENGMDIYYPEHYNFSQPEYYQTQYEWTTRQLMKSIDTILENDPHAVILLQSDHGLRNREGNDYEIPFDLQQEDTRCILNALYFGGEAVDIKGVSAVNTVRQVLTMLGGDFPPVEDPDRVTDLVAEPITGKRPEKPGTPMELTVKAAEKGCTLRWSAVDGADGYMIFDSTRKNEQFAYVGTVTDGTSYTDTEGTAKTWYRVRAFVYENEQYALGYLTEASRVDAAASVKSAAALAQEIGFAAKNVDGAVELSWKALDNGATCSLVRMALDGSGLTRLTESCADGSWTDTTAEPGTAYRYAIMDMGARMLALTVGGPGWCSPAGLRVTMTGDGATLTWDAVPGAEGYKVFRSDKPGSGFLGLEQSCIGTTYTDTGAKPGDVYYYKVVAWLTLDGVRVNTPSVESVGTVG